MRCVDYLQTLMLCSALIAPAMGSTIERMPKNDHGETPVVVNGEIIRGDADKFVNAIDGIDDGTGVVLLASPGGVGVEGMAIGEMTRAHKFHTAVVGEDSCASVCGLIWLAGEPRYVWTTAKIGFHAGYNVQTHQVDAIISAFVGSYLTTLGFGLDVIGYATRADPDKMQWLSHADAERLHISYGVVKGDDTKSFGRGDWVEPQPAHFPGNKPLPKPKTVRTERIVMPPPPSTKEVQQTCIPTSDPTTSISVTVQINAGNHIKSMSVVHTVAGVPYDRFEQYDALFYNDTTSHDYYWWQGKLRRDSQQIMEGRLVLHDNPTRWIYSERRQRNGVWDLYMEAPCR
jgi:hypothetical protein